MTKKKITKNFWVSEIFKVPWEELSLKTQFLANHLCKYTLQPLRDMDPDIIIDITSGARNGADVSRLKRLGYHPTVTTDHFFGEPQVIPPDTDKNLAKIKKYGSIYTYSMGAVDIVPRISQSKVPDYFKRIVDYNNEGIVDAGQIILEKGKYTYWIHISNPVSIVYRYEFAKKVGLQKHMYLKSMNNGKTYTIYTPK